MAFLTWSGNLPSGFVFNWGDGNVTLTHSANTLTLAGGVLVVPSGQPIIQLVGETNTGFDLRSTAAGLRAQGSLVLEVHDSLVEIRGPGPSSTFLLTESDNVFQQGSDAAIPSAQLFKGPDARAGIDTNTGGGAQRFSGGRSTGTGLPGLVGFQGSLLTTTTGTGANALIDRFIANAVKVLTNNVATAVVNVTVANNTVAGGVLDYVIECTDGTDVQVESGRAVFSTGNKAGVIAGTITEVNSQQNVTGASTLATTWAISNANPAVISINANSSLVPSTGYPRITFSIHNLGQQAIAIQ